MADGWSKETLTRFYAKSPKTAVGVGITASLLLFAGAAAFLWYAWFQAIPAVHSWAFDPTIWWRAVLAAFAYFFLAFLPLGVAAWPFMFLGLVIDITVGTEEKRVGERLDQAETRQTELEEEIKDLAGETGTDAVLPMRISRWSGAQLEAYYKTGIDQARRSFRYSVLAMWLGFIVLVAGVTIQLLNPLEEWGFEPTTTNVNFIVIAAGVIIEFIAALFLWVHRSALQNLSRLYNAQMYRHSVILSNQLAQGIEDPATKDKTRQTIIQSLLVPPEDLTLEEPEAKSGRTLGGLLGAKPTKAA